MELVHYTTRVKTRADEVVARFTLQIESPTRGKLSPALLRAASVRIRAVLPLVARHGLHHSSLGSVHGRFPSPDAALRSGAPSHRTRPAQRRRRRHPPESVLGLPRRGPGAPRREEPVPLRLEPPLDGGHLPPGDASLGDEVPL